MATVDEDRLAVGRRREAIRVVVRLVREEDGVPEHMHIASAGARCTPTGAGAVRFGRRTRSCEESWRVL